MPVLPKDSQTAKYLILLVSSLVLIVSCASPYIGTTVKMNHPAVCEIKEFPATCSYTATHLEINYTITKTGNPGEYKITGSANHPAGATKTWTDYSGASFTLYIIDNGIVVETITIAGGMGSLDKPITFSREFKPKHKIQATLINYQMDVQG